MTQKILDQENKIIKNANGSYTFWSRNNMPYCLRKPFLKNSGLNYISRRTIENLTINLLNKINNLPLVRKINLKF